jgi:hypothetical protein
MLLDKIREGNNLKTEYETLQNKNFILENVIKEKDSIIKKLNRDLNYILKYPVFRESKREIKIFNPYEIEDDLFDDLDYYQDLLLSKSKGYNKYSNKINNLKEIMNKFKKSEINNSSKNIFQTLIVIEPYRIKDNLNKTESYDFDELNSDSEDNVNFCDKIDNINYIKNKEKKIIIPKIDLKQIEYNKRKFKPQDEEISLSRSKNDDISLMESKIRRLKQKIKNFKRRVKMKFEKIIQYEQSIPEMKSILKNYGYDYENELVKNGIKSERLNLTLISEE